LKNDNCFRKDAAMNTLSTTVVASQNFFSQNGRKGVSYDWQSLYAAAEAATIDCELAALAPALAE